MRPSAEGFILLESSFKPIYSSPGAIEILAFPEKPREIKSLDKFVTERIRGVLFKERSDPQLGFVTEFSSGKRRYSCRAFVLNSHPGNSHSDHPAYAILIERCQRVSFDTAQLAKQFNLTPREQETVEYLVQGLTSKEIAARMRISPNTVKAFLRLIMVKMGTTTRSGIVGKVFAATH